MINKGKTILIFIVVLTVLAISPDLSAQEVKMKINKADFVNTDNYKKAKKAAKKGLKHYKRATSGDYRQAVKYFDDAYQLNNKNVALNYYLGMSHLHSTDKKKSLEYLKMVYQNNPNITQDILFWLGRAYHVNYQFEKAREMYLKYRASLPVDEQLAISKGITKYVQETEYGEKLCKTPQRVFVDNIGQEINTEHAEYAPVVSVDGKTIYFTSQRPDPNKRKSPIYKATQNYYEKIFKSTRKGENWTAVEKLKLKLSSKQNSAVVGLYPNGQDLIMFDGKEKYGDFTKAQAKSKIAWKKPSKREFRKVNTKHRETSASVSYDGKTMYFVSFNPEKVVGGSDIFVSTRKTVKDPWGYPTNVGSLINTEYDEDAVFISPDGQTLYFSSNGHSSMGGFDIFKSDIQSDGTWGVPVNLGYPINTPEDEMFFSITANQRYGYHASLGQEDSKGNWDIYMTTFLGPEKPLIQNSEDILIASLAKPITETVIEKTVEIKTIRLTIVKGTINDSFTERPVSAVIEIVDNDKNEVIQTTESNPETGEYMVTLPSGKNYAMMVVAKDYLHHSENFNIPAATNYQEISKNILLHKLEAGSKVVLNNIFFEFGKTIIHPSSYAELQRVETMMNTYKTLVIEISGHTDNVGSAASNIRISTARAKAVVDYLITRGVPAERLTYKGYGFEQPIADNKTEDGRQQNRRVEFKILKK